LKNRVQTLLKSHLPVAAFSENPPNGTQIDAQTVDNSFAINQIGPQKMVNLPDL